MVHAVGGALLLAGTIGHIAKGGGSEVGRLDASGPGLLVLLGFMVNAAVPPLHAWLTDAYPESSPGAGVLLSAFATKSAVYALARVYPGESILVIAGVTMALYGVVFAALENDIRRLLSYHIVSQVGYMVTGVGLGSALALNGAVAHAMAHILYKGLLFMAAGAVIYATDRRGLSTLGGLAGALPATLTLYMVGALAISGAPLLNGFVSKSLTVAAAHAEGRWGVEWLLMLAAVGTFLSVGLKLPVLAFGGPPAAAPARPVAPGMLAAMTVTAVLCAVTGSAPSLLYAWLPFEMSYRPYSSAHVFESLQVLAGTALGFLLARRWIVASAGRTLDFDRLYRVVGAGLVIRAGRAAAAGANRLEAVVGSLVSMPLGRAAAVSRPVGYAILIILAVLALGLVIPLGL
jgi:multicomponent Na+:H+ antiporter subunit D